VPITNTASGTANLFLAFAPLTGVCCADVALQRRKEDWAHLMKAPLTGPYAHAEKVILA